MDIILVSLLVTVHVYVWALINQVHPHSYGLWLTIQIIKSVDISELIDINQSIPITQFYQLKRQISLENLLFSHNSS